MSQSRCEVKLKIEPHKTLNKWCLIFDPYLIYKCITFFTDGIESDTGIFRTLRYTLIPLNPIVHWVFRVMLKRLKHIKRMSYAVIPTLAKTSVINLKPRCFSLLTSLYPGVHWVHHSRDESVEGTVSYAACDSTRDWTHGGHHSSQIQLYSDPAQAEYLWGCHDLEVTLPGCQVGRLASIVVFAFNF